MHRFFHHNKWIYRKQATDLCVIWEFSEHLPLPRKSSCASSPPLRDLCVRNFLLCELINSEQFSISYGALYAHPLEGLAIDTIAFTLGILLSGLTPRQTMVFDFLTIWKAMGDHCGYVLPLDPLNYLAGNNAKYHDVHHQTWGLKVRKNYLT